MNITSFFAAMRTPDSRSLPPPTGAELAALQKLCGEDWTEGKLAFEKFPRKKRNVIVFVWESVGAAFIKSHHPLGVAQTPELDALWRTGGVYCSECYAESPLSAQSGWSILTGMSPPARPVIFTYGEHMPPFTATLPAKLHEQGFATAMFGGSNFQTAAMDRIVDVCAFNVYEDLRNLSNRAKFGVGEFGVEDAALVDRTLTWIDGLPKGTPFFTLIWNSDTHYPYRYPGMPEALSNASPLERYYACVEHSDKEIGKLYRELQSRGLDKDTLLVVVGDHGEGMGRPPRPYDRGHSMLVYDDSIHVPLWFINPELPSSAAIGHLCRLADMFPTILSVSGASPAEHIDGHSLAETYPAQPLFARSIVWWPIAAKAGPFTLILSDPQSEPELYNTAADPSESHDLAKEDADTASVLMRAVLRFTVDRFKNDESFDFGFKFLPTGPATHPSRPTIDDLMKQK